MLGLAERRKSPKMYPSFDQMCAYFYVMGATGRLWHENLDDDYSVNALYFKYAVRKSSKNPLKRFRTSLKSKASIAAGFSVGENDIIGVNISGACREILNNIKGTAVVSQVFYEASYINEGYNYPSDAAVTATAIVEKIGGSTNLSSDDGSVLEGIVIDDIDTSNTSRVPRFDLAEEEDFTPDQISQLFQSYLIGLAARTRRKLESVDAVLNAENKIADIAHRVGGGGIEKLEYSDTEASQRLLLERE